MKRYQSSVTVGRITTTIDFDELPDAEAMQARYRKANGNNRDAFGGIYDRTALANVGTSWRGGFWAKPVNHFARLIERAIASGQPVSVIGSRGAAHFNGEMGRVARG